MSLYPYIAPISGIRIIKLLLKNNITVVGFMIQVNTIRNILTQ
jgi:hypothetical protein